MDLSAGPLLPHLSNALLDLRCEVTHETLQKINKRGYTFHVSLITNDVDQLTDRSLLEDLSLESFLMMIHRSK